MNRSWARTVGESNVLNKIIQIRSKGVKIGKYGSKLVKMGPKVSIGQEGGGLKNKDMFLCHINAMEEQCNTNQLCFWLVSLLVKVPLISDGYSLHFEKSYSTLQIPIIIYFFINYCDLSDCTGLV